MKLGIIDSNASNLNSVYQALLRLKNEGNLNFPLDLMISSKKQELKSADKLIFPGVGAISAVMEGLKRNDLVDFVKDNQKPLLGICLGMQILFSGSEEVPLKSESHTTEGLNLIQGEIKKITCDNLPLPHMGWNSLECTSHPLFKGLKENSYVYFVHSYCAPVGPYTIASSEYGQKFSAAVCQDNFLGVQFHPEKSGTVGAKILQNFLEL